LKQVFHTVLNDWDFDMVKLDFLYGVAILPQKGKSRGQVMWEAMQFLRECVGEKKILGCGVPLYAAQFTTDFCRIGPDVSLTWNFPLTKFTHHRESISTEIALQNSLNRFPLNGHGFLNDPDVFILRDKNTKLTYHQKRTLFIWNQIFGNLLFTSDDISEYNDSTMQIYLSQFPVLPKEILKTYKFNDDYIIEFKIYDKKYTCITNFSPNVKKADWGRTTDVQPYETILLGENGKTEDLVHDTHIFPASNCKSIDIQGNNISISWHEPTKSAGKLTIHVEKDGEYFVNGKGGYWAKNGVVMVRYGD
ncbi:MAG: hypothetical protein ACKVTZ_01810, partial [Bacteroidia bacterium]